MQDRFKFRIFEYETKEMIELDAVGYSSFDPFAEGKSRLIMIPSGLGNTFHYDKQCLYDNDKFSEPMQSTGLKDKNGKLVYEGDILGNIETYKCKIYQVPLEVVWENGGFALVGSYSSKSSCRFVRYNADEIECLEIIGNKYENEELINE